MNHNKDTFLTLIDDHRLILFKVANAYSRNPQDREDLVQEMILQLWRAFDRYNEQVKLSTWIYRIALNVAISNLRKMNTRDKVFTRMDHVVDVPAEETQNAEESQLLMNFIHALDEMNKALMLLYLDGYNHEEIAQVLGISKSNVGTRMGRIKNKFKKQVKQLES